jgi:hypothetical protein
VENFPDSNLPYILYYRDGKLIASIDKRVFVSSAKTSLFYLEELFRQIGIKEFAKEIKETTKGFISEKLNKRKKSEDEYSDDEEREDKQYISNKVFVKY